MTPFWTIPTGLGGLAAVLLLAIPACASARPAETKPFRLKVGESAEIEGRDFGLSFEGVTSDSRCPRNVQCVWAGEARVVLSVRTASDERTELTFAVPPGGGASQTYRDTTIRIVALEPQTEAGKKIPRDDYVVELVVEAAGERR